MGWPFAAKTGIGSLPHDEVDGALRLSFSCEVPFLPELKGEDMVGTALDDRPLRCWPAFLRELELRQAAFGKIQLAGPSTVGQGAHERIQARAVAMIQAVARTGARPVFFLDEPALNDLTHVGPLIAAAKRAGAIVGLHCCGQADWPRVLGLGPDVLSFDARLSLDAVLADPAALRASRVALAIGLVPTDPGARYSVEELVDAVDVSLRATRCTDLLHRALLTPACGLATRTVEDAERIFGELAEAQLRLRTLS